MNGRPLLSVVRKPGMKRLSERERLIAEGKKLFPNSEAMVAKWVEAKLAVAGRQPKVRIGTEQHVAFARCISSSASRPWTAALPRALRRLFSA